MRLIRGDTITPEAVRWIWDGYLAAGKLHILAGRPGTGKTTLAMSFAAAISTGGRWPDGTGCEAGDVLIWSGEDDPSDTLAPRLIANGAAMGRIHIVGGIEADGKAASFDPARHMAALELEAARIGNVRLLLIDPVVSAVTGDGNSNTEVRRALQPIVDFAARLDCAALGITHFTKGSDGRDVVERVTGSLAFGAAARIVLAAAKLKDDDEQAGRRIMVRAKSNIGPDTGGFGYDLEYIELAESPGVFASRVLWCGPVDGTARELLREAEADDDGEANNAREFLRELLRHGSLTAREVFAAGDAEGYSRAQLHRAKKRLGATAHKDGMKGGWRWALPEDDGAGVESAEDVEGNGFPGVAPSDQVPDRGASEDYDSREDPTPNTPSSSTPSAPSWGSWVIRRKDGSSFPVRTVPAATLAEMREAYPGAEVEPEAEAA